MLELFRKFKEKREQEEVAFTSTLDMTVDDLDLSVRNLMVFDDCVTEKKQESIEEFFVRGRKKNAFVIYITQSYYSTPTDIRKNCNYFAFFELQRREIRQIFREIDGPIADAERPVPEMQQPYDFFMLDLMNPAHS